MNNKVIRFSDPRKMQEEIRDQACAWLVKLDRGISPTEMAQLNQWVAENPSHRRMLINMAAMWDQVAMLSELSEIFPLDASTVALRSRRRGHPAALAIAALVLIAGIFLGWLHRDAWYPGKTLDETYVTAIGERRQLNLPDDSIVTLNTNTRAHFAFSRQVRSVVLEHGEAFFTVARDANRPFRVQAGSRVVEAVGTAFTVQHAAGRELEVLVTEGQVNLLELVAPNQESVPADAEAPAQPAATTVSEKVIPLSAGQRLQIAQEVQQMEQTEQVQQDVLKPDEVEMKLAWRVGMLVFQGDSLETVLREVSRYTTVKLQADDAVRDIRIEGLFRAGDIDGLLVAMEKNFNLSSRRIGEDEIIFTARSQEE